MGGTEGDRHGRGSALVTGASVPDALEDLLAGVAAGDRVAFATLYARTSSKLYGVVLRILPDKGRADDVLQDVYIKVWHAAGAYDATRGRPITWLATIARNRALDIVRQTRSAGRARFVDVDPERLEAIVDESLDPAELAALRRCLGTLPDEHRDCILLAYCEGASREELGERFARPVGTIKSWISRGLLLLRGCLSDG